MKTSTLLFSSFLSFIFITAQSQYSFEVTKTGKGQPILLFPGFACTADVFDDLIPELQKNYEVHAFTYAGFGDVPSISFPWLPQIKEEIEQYVIQQHLKDPIIIGHSMGGTLGLWLTANSDKYSHLIVIDALPAMGALMIPDFNPDALQYDNPHSQQILAMDKPAFAEMADQSAAFMTSNLQKQKVISHWIKSSDRQTYVNGYTDLLKLDLRDSLKKITTPVTILAATQPYGKEQAEITYKKQYKNLKQYKLIFAEGSRHFIMFDRPDWLKEQINTVMKENE